MKQRIQGIIMGVLVTVVLLGTATVFATTVQTIEVTFGGVRTTLLGQEFVVRDEDGMLIQSITYDGRVYIPMDTILYALGDNVQWNENTQILNFGISQQATPVIARRYLESDIFASESSSGWNSHPENGSFTISGVTYHRGASTNITPNRAGSTDTISAIYDLTGLNVTRLSGTFGLTSWINGTRGSITVIDADTGRFLGGGSVSYILSAGGRRPDPDDSITQINIDIPQGVHRISITMEVRSHRSGVAFGDAFFE